ncbi:Uncharacterised protein [Moraxella caviae]|nr:Uncharacterised protein [Moraxella caviae]
MIIDMPPQLEQQIIKNAEQAGQSQNEYLVALLSKTLKTDEPYYGTGQKIMSYFKDVPPPQNDDEVFRLPEWEPPKPAEFS